MKTDTLARAIYELTDSKDIKKIISDFSDISETLSTSKELSDIILNPSIDTINKLAVLEKLFGNRLQVFTKRILAFIAHKNQFSVLMDIDKSLNNIIDEDVNIENVTIYSSEKIDTKLLSSIADIVVDDKESRVDNIVDKELLGGFRIESESYIVDHSLQSHLDNLQEMLRKN